MSKSRSTRSYNSGGVELWDLQVIEIAQKAWTFERYLHSTITNQSISFANLWTHNSRIKKDCKDAWLKHYNKQTRKTQNSKLDISLTTAYIKIPKLKKIYQDIQNINNPNWNEEIKQHNMNLQPS